MFIFVPDVCFGGQNKTAVSTALAALKLRGQGDSIIAKTLVYYENVSPDIVNQFWTGTSIPCYLLSFYVQSCTTSSPWNYLSNYTLPMDVGVNASMTILLSDPISMSAACGQDISPFLATLSGVEPYISQLQKNLQTSMELSSCSRVYPLFNEYVFLLCNT